MTAKALFSPVSEPDSLSCYIDGVRKLPPKLAQIAENQRHAAASLGRAVIALRSIAALSAGKLDSNFRNLNPAIGNGRE